MRKPAVVIYHGPTCFDGFTAAWVFKLFRPDTTDFFPIQYGDTTIPDVRGREVWILDFSFPRPAMKTIIKESERTIVLDHHKTAAENLHGLLQEMRIEGIQRSADILIFDEKRSGAGMTYDFLEDDKQKRAGYRLPRHNGRRANWLVDHVEDGDLWRFAIPGSPEVRAFLGSKKMDFETWSKILKDGEENAIRGGGMIMEYLDSYGEKACDTAKMEKIAGHLVPTMTIAYMNCSEHLAKLLTKYPDAPFAASYFRRSDGKWQFSLRSRGNFDVAEIAKTFGGGGHKPAAGFEADRLPWDDEEMSVDSSIKLAESIRQSGDI